MKSTSLRRASVSCVSILAAAGLGLGLAGPATAAPSLQDLADNIKAGLKTPSASANTNQRSVAPTAAAGPVVIPDGTQSTSNEPTGAGPAQTRFLPAFAYTAGGKPNVAPPGSNNFSCKPKAGQRPVVLVHGTWENAYNNFAMISPELAKAGYCVFTLNYGIATLEQGGGVISLIPGAYGVGDIPTSAGQLATFVDKVLSSTGASKVDIVGHSQGGLTARYYMKLKGGASKVQKLITLGATNHGTTLLGIGKLGRLINNAGIDILGPVGLGIGISGVQQVIDSDVVKAVNAGGDTLPGIDYTIIRTKYDEVTTPSDSTFLKAGPGATVNNVTLQDFCPIDFSDHVSMSYSPRAVSLIKKALNPSAGLVCLPNGFVIG